MKSILKSTYSQLNYVNLIIKETDDPDARTVQKMIKKFIVQSFMEEVGALIRELSKVNTVQKVTPIQVNIAREHKIVEPEETVRDFNNQHLNKEASITIHPNDFHTPTVVINKVETDIIITNDANPTILPINIVEKYETTVLEHGKNNIQPIESHTIAKKHGIIEPEHGESKTHLNIPTTTTNKTTANNTNSTLPPTVNIAEEQIEIGLVYYTDKKKRSQYIYGDWLRTDTDATITDHELTSDPTIAQYTYNMALDKHKYKYPVTSATQLKVMIAIAKYLYTHKHITTDPVTITEALKQNYKKHLSRT